MERKDCIKFVMKQDKLHICVFVESFLFVIALRIYNKLHNMNFSNNKKREEKTQFQILQ